MFDLVHHIAFPRAYPVRSTPRRLKLMRFALRAGWAIVPRSVAFVAVLTVGQPVVMSFHPVTGYVQLLMGIIILLLLL
jgi:hypothetical protein